MSAPSLGVTGTQQQKSGRRLRLKSSARSPIARLMKRHLQRHTGTRRHVRIQATHLSQMYIQTWFGEWRVS